MRFVAISEWLPPKELASLRTKVERRTHSLVDINGFGLWWEAPLREDEIEAVVGKSDVSPMRGTLWVCPLRRRLLSALGLPDQHLVPRAWSSVFRRVALEEHTDNADPTRRIGVAFYTNRHWHPDDGGGILLHGGHRIMPEPNTLVAFSIDEKSWHAVEHVRAPSPVHRHSLVGWLNAPQEDWRDTAAIHDTGERRKGSSFRVRA